MPPNYFEFYDLPMSFQLDTGAVKRKFYALSKQYHPDYYTLEGDQRQAEVLELSTFNNQAYKVLSDFDQRMQYILEQKGLLADEGNPQLPQTFLMEMMDINEQLMELEFDFDATVHKQLLSDLEVLEGSLLKAVSGVLEHWEDGKSDVSELESVKEYYYKKRYLLRIRENLNKFATH